MGLYKRKDSNVWWMSFTANGKSYRISTDTTDKKLADKILAKVKTLITEGKWFEVDVARSHSFDELMERYSREVITTKAVRTQETNRIQLSHLLSFFGGLTLDKITPESISQYRFKRISKGVKLQTVKYELVLLSHAFNFAQREWQWVRSNPMKFIKMPRQDNQIERWLTYEEQERLLPCCEDWLKQIVLFALNTGLRMNEIFELTWKNVDMARKTVTVMESKNKEKRTLPLNDNAVDILKTVLSESKVLNVEGYIFTLKGRKLIKQQLQYYFNKAVKQAKIAHFRFHDTRHTFATRLVQEGVDLYKVSKLLGHKDIKTTQRYAHHYPESLRSAVDILGGIDGKKKAQFHDSFTFSTAPSPN